MVVWEEPGPGNWMRWTLPRQLEEGGAIDSFGKYPARAETVISDSGALSAARPNIPDRPEERRTVATLFRSQP
jgi:hypothetical protein